MPAGRAGARVRARGWVAGFRLVRSLPPGKMAVAAVAAASAAAAAAAAAEEGEEEDCCWCHW